MLYNKKFYQIIKDLLISKIKINHLIKLLITFSKKISFFISICVLFINLSNNYTIYCKVYLNTIQKIIFLFRNIQENNKYILGKKLLFLQINYLF